MQNNKCEHVFKYLGLQKKKSNMIQPILVQSWNARGSSKCKYVLMSYNTLLCQKIDHLNM